MRIPLKHLVKVGTEFNEDGYPCVLTRVTDLMFDTLNKETGAIKVRNLAAWESSAFTNRLAGVRNLLSLPPR